ncbi:MAG: ATP-binding protein [Actinomycetes bacterium]
MGRDSLALQLSAAGVLPSGTPTSVVAMPLDPVPLAPGLARRFVNENLSRASAAQREAALLITSELVTSVLLHARTSLEVAVCNVAKDVILAVIDHDPGDEREAAKGLRGRGKALVTALADDYGTVGQGRCRTVWVVLREHGRATCAGAVEATTLRS